MNFYRRRPLALVFALCIAVFAVCAFSVWYVKLILLLLLAVLVPVTVLTAKHFEISYICNMPAKAFVSVTAAFVMSAVLLCFAYYDVYAARFSSLAQGEISAVVTDVQNSSPYSETYAVRILTFGGTKYHGRGLLRSDTPLDLCVGDIIRTGVKFTPLEDFYSFTDASRISLLADGYVFAADISGTTELVGESRGVERTFIDIRRTVSAKLSLYLGRDGANIVRALFLGEREDIGVLERDFKYTGTSHLLALSGMHLAVLTLAVDGLLKRLSLPRKIRCFLMISLIASYAAMTGFLMSVLRAGIMLAVYYISGCTRAEGDRVTALFGAVWLIALVNPAAVFDVGLQLSFFATLGVVLLAQASAHNEGRGYFIRTGLLRRTADDFGRSVAISLGAVFFVLPLQWMYFGTVSTMSVPATLLLSVLCSGILTLTLPYLLFAALKCHFAAATVGAMIDAIYTVLSHIAGFLAKHARLVWLGYPFAFPIFLCAAAVIAYMVYRRKYTWVHALVPMCAACALFFACVLMSGALYNARVTLDYSAEEKSDMLLLKSGDDSILIDCSDATASAVDLISDTLDKRGVDELDVLILTELTRRHVGAVRRVLASCKIGSIIFPEPHEEYELFISSEIARISEEFGAANDTYERADGFCEIYTADACITFAPEARLARSERELLAFSADVAGVKIAYAGACTWEDERVWSLVKDAEYVIIGRRGPNIKDGPKGKAEGEKKLIFISGEQAPAFDGWLSDYTGRLRFGDGFGMVIEP